MADKEQVRKPGDKSDIIAEYRLLNAVIKNKDFYNDSRVTEDTFITPTAKSVYVAISNLYNQGTDITQASLLQAGNDVDYSITNQIVQGIFTIDTQAPSSIDDILSALKRSKFKSSVLHKLDEIKGLVSADGTLDANRILEKLYSLDEEVVNSNKDKSKLLDFKTWSERYKEDLRQRKTGRKYSYGDILLDGYLFKGATPGNITIITAATNMGKSTFALSLQDNLINNNSPAMYISLEMGTIDTYDRLIAKRLEIENKVLYEPDCIDDIIDKVDQEMETMSYCSNFAFCEATSIDLTKLRSLIREYKTKTHQDYCLVTIDLLSGLKGFMAGPNGASTAASIEMHMNELEALAKEENVHIIGIVQLNRQSDNAKISHVEQINNLRPTLGDVKNSNAYCEKATTLLSLFRPKYYADRYCQSDPATATMEDILEVQVLKDRNSPSGKIFKYMFDGKFFKLLPLVEDEDNSAANLDIDY